jgi:hypothetical protein
VSPAFIHTAGPDPKGPVYFLPWRTSFATAQRYGLLLERWSSCYELPESIVSAEPELCAASVRVLEADVQQRAAVRGAPTLIIGFSMGTVPATAIANKLGARLWSFASADRGELMMWSSPAAQPIREQARRYGYGIDDYERCLRTINPIACVSGIARESRFAVGVFDRYVPRERSERLIEEASRRIPKRNVLRLPLGHIGLIAASRWIQRRWRSS